MLRRKLSSLQIIRDPPPESESMTEDVGGIGSSDVLETLEDIEIEGANGGRRRTRGRTTLPDLYNLPPGERVKVSSNSNGQPIGAEASVLANYLGVVARNGSILLINHISWHEMPGGNKNQALNLVKTKFSLEVPDKYLKQTLGKKWRDHKSNLKKKFFKNDLTLEGKKQNPPGILRYQWEDACDFWNSNKGESRERIGVSSREKQKFTHTAGSKSFARIANEHACFYPLLSFNIEITSGSSVGRIQLFDITHTRKDGSPITSEAAEIMEKLREKRAEYEATASTHNSAVNANDIDNQVIAEVFGPERYGRVRGQGSFVTPTAYFGSSSSQYMPSQSRSINVEVDRIKQQLQQEMDAKIAEIQAQTAARDAEREAAMAARKAEKEATFAAREATLQQKYENIESQLAKLLKMMQKDQSQDSPSDP
ncbi:hypothetical protein GQ457_12G002640 [Hibiscus cannabinus]